MKKNLIITFILTFLISITTVYAEVVKTSTGDTQEIKVGTVDTLVYSADVVWSDFKFDYLFNQYKYEWEWVTQNDPEMDCRLGYTGEPLGFDFLNELNTTENEFGYYSAYAFKDSNHKVRFYKDEIIENDALSTPERVYVCGYNKEAKIWVYDNSKVGKVNPKISWTGTEEYSFVDINGYIYDSNSDSMIEITNNHFVTDSEIDTGWDTDRQWTLGIGLTNNTDDFVTPTTNDIVGTVTIELING